MKSEINENSTITANSKQLEVLREHFPNCFDKDGAFQPHKLEELVKASGADITKEGYTLNWLGKSYARLLANENVRTLLAANTEHNKQPENANSENLLIQGDNLEVLKHLKNAYREKVKMIYIDPPYNTGSDGFVYADDRKFTPDQLSHLAGIDEDEAKRILEFTQSQSNSHSAWLTFMFPRLYIARELLREDGVIFISIDDNEQAQLKLLCDEVFGEENFVSQLVWAAGKKNDSKLISNSHEYVFAYLKQKTFFDLHKTTWRQRKLGIDAIYSEYNRLKKTHKNTHSIVQKELKKWFKKLPDDSPTKRQKHYSSVDERGIYFPDNISWPGGGGPKYEVLHPQTGKACKIPSRGWMFADQNRMKQVMDENRVHFGLNETTVPCIKSYLIDREYEVPYSVFYRDGRAATKRLRTLMDSNCFENPKDETIISEIINFISNEEKDYLILDFFAGSGTTAHAVMALNAEDGGNRKCISVQLDEPTAEKSEARKAGYDTIFEITRERIKRAAAKIKKEHPNAKCDFGFKEFRTIESFEGYLDEADTMEEFAAFEAEKLTEEQRRQLLLTWQAHDRLPLHRELDSVDLATYPAHQGDDKLYFMNAGLELKHIVELLERIDNDKTFAPRKLVVLGDLLSSKATREITEAINSYNNRKGIELTLDIRF